MFLCILSLLILSLIQKTAKSSPPIQSVALHQFCMSGLSKIEQINFLLLCSAYCINSRIFGNL